MATAGPELFGEAEVFAAMVMVGRFRSNGQGGEQPSLASDAETCSAWNSSTSAVTSPALSDSAAALRACTASTTTGSNAARAAAIARYRLKKASRSFTKKIRYQSRKVLATNRARVGGRFVKASERTRREESAVSSDSQPLEEDMSA